MEHLGVVDEEELDHVCSERETALDRPLHQWEREIIHHHLRNESLKAVSREERLHIPGFDKDKVVSWFSWFFMVPGWFFMVFFPECTRPKLYPGLTIQSRSAARRAA